MDNRGLEKLDQWLLKYGNDDSILSASELDGFFAAIVSAPRQVAPRSAPVAVAALGPVKALESYARFAARFG